MDAVHENTHARIQCHRLFVEQGRHPVLQLIQPAIQIGLHRGWQKHTGVIGTEIVQIEVDGVLDKSGETAAAVLLISSLQACLFLRRQVDGKLHFFAQNSSFPGYDPYFFLEGVGSRG